MTKIIGNYRILKRLGKGSFGEVYKAIHNSTSQIYAIKSLEKYQLNRLPRLKNQLLLEVSALRACNNPNIIKLFDVLKTANKYYLVMECCEGGSLEEFVEKNGPLNEEIVKKILGQLVDALIFMKKSNIMHRDLKPANILLTNPDIEQAELKIADFGFARFLNPNSYTESYLGTPLYMAPEVLQSESYSFKADIWSLGAIIYEILFGICAFNGQTQTEIRNLQKMPLYFPREISGELKDLIQKMLTFDFNERISAEDIKNHPFLNPSLNIQTIEDSIDEDYIILTEREENLEIINNFIRQANEYFIGESNYLSSLLGFYERIKNLNLAKAIARFWLKNNEDMITQAELLIQRFQLAKEDPSSKELFEAHDTLKNLCINSIKRDAQLNLVSIKAATQIARELMKESEQYILREINMHNLSCSLYLAKVSQFYDKKSQEIRNYYNYILSMYEDHRIL
ncbi:unnamed protein product [Blepharisma stoltei]|uniref:non-specific serine/threonine protein kinase n=1 Tax=Blepharisma stoltei TaxID=1481888 RepID=A0AAU9J3W5_9CILI|nr:unnamed protein product [Blepharisma stoltei]